MQDETIPVGLCQCGCGLPAPIATRNEARRGYVKGRPMRFRSGHKPPPPGPLWVAEDRGYATPCHIWQRWCDKRGYGRMGIRPGGTDLAHRNAWIDAHGAIPDGLLVCHRCDQPSCVNVEHLFLGTHADNRADCVAKGRQARGHDLCVARAKLTPAQVAEIRDLLARGRRRPALAIQFGVTRRTIGQIDRGETWRDS